jgi:hypothetical protein
MIPPVIHDLRAIYELASHGMELDFERERLSAQSPLTDMLAARVSFGNLGAETFVLYSNGRRHRPLGVVQVRLRKNRPEAEIVFISPSLDRDQDAVTTWYRLLAEATNGAGELGCQRIYAQLPVHKDGHRHSGAEEVFRQAGFSVYAREEIYYLSAGGASALRARVNQATLRRQRKRDAWNILRLYSAITPRPVQLAEGMLNTEGVLAHIEEWWDQARGTGYVFERDNVVQGVVRITRGRLASWLRLHLHPQAAGLADEMLAEAVWTATRARNRPIYAAVRDYESGVRGALEAAGFEWVSERSLMVKHTTARVKEAVPWLAPVRETPLPLIQQMRNQEKEFKAG